MSGSSSRDKKIVGQFVALPYVLLRSEAWLAISHAARVAYVHLKLQIRYGGQREIVLTYRAMAPIMERRTYARAIRELEEVGLVHRSQRGGLFRRVNIFILSQDWKRYKVPQLRKSVGQVAKVPQSQGAEVPPSAVPEQPLSGRSATCSEIY